MGAGGGFLNAVTPQIANQLGNTGTPVDPNVGQTTAANAMQPVDLASQSATTPTDMSAMQTSMAATTATPMAASTSNPNTATLGTGQTTSPYVNSTNPYVQAAQATTMGNLYGAQAATQANRINQNTPYSSLNYTQGVDANGNPTWTANQQLAQPLQQSLNNIQGQLAQSTASPFDVSQYQAKQVGQGPNMQMLGAATQQQGIGNAPTLGQVGQGPQFSNIGNAANLQNQVQGTGMQGWDAATGLLMSRLQPQMAQQAESQKALLANQGIVPGTQAYDNAMRTFSQQQNDLLTSAQMQGATLQNQMFNQNLAAGQFGNQALTQQNQNQLANLGFNNQVGQQGFANQLAGTQANNAALTQGNQNQLANLGFSNQAQQQNYANQQAMLQQNNTAAQQQFANQLAGTQANNAALQQNYNQALQQRNLPLQQLGAFQQATQPGYINPYTQAAVAGPDYLGAYTTSQAAQIAQQNAANARTANTQSGLYGLGAAALLGGGGLGNLGTATQAGTGLLGLGSQAANGLSQWWNNLGGDPTAGGTITPDLGQAAQTASDFYGSGYDQLAGWSI